MKSNIYLWQRTDQFDIGFVKSRAYRNTYSVMITERNLLLGSHYSVATRKIAQVNLTDAKALSAYLLSAPLAVVLAAWTTGE